MTKANGHIEEQLKDITKSLLVESGQHYIREIRVNDNLHQQLKIDSLMRAEMFSRISKEFDVDIPDSFISKAETLQEIADYIHKAPNAKIKKDPHAVSASHGKRKHFDLSQSQSLIDVLLTYGQKAPNMAHIYFQHENGREEIITYGSLLEKSMTVAANLKALGLTEGETVAIMQPTNPGFFYSFMGVLIAGGIPVPIYPPFRMHMIEAYAKTEAHILNNAGVRYLITFEEAERLSQLLKSFVPGLRAVKTVKELLQQREAITPFKASAEQFALIQYTSGSTSNPKGVLLSHANLLANIRGYGETIEASEKDVAVSWLPLYHDMGLIAMWLGSLYYGASLVLLTPFSFLNHPEKWLWAIHYHRGTLSGGPNFGYELCVKKLDTASLEGLDLSSWRAAANGAEKVYPRTLDLFAKKFAPYGFNRKILLPVYGLAEATVALTIPPTDREFRVDYVEREAFEKERKAIQTDEKGLEFVSCGKPMRGHEVRIVDETGNVLPERNVGELQFKGPSAMQGYYNNPEATRAIYHDGWFASGDFAYIADDEVFITGRRKDLIIKAGRNIYPAEIEELLLSVKGIRPGCITAFSVGEAERGTEKMVIVAETKQEDKVKREQMIDEIQSIVNETLDLFADEVLLVPPHAVPKTSSGKLQRSGCKKLYEEGKLAAKSAPPWVQITRLVSKGIFNKVTHNLKTVVKALYTGYMGIMVFVTMLPIYLLSFVLPKNTTQHLIRFWCKLIPILGGVITSIRGKEHLTKKSMIYAANHASYLDALFLFALLPSNTYFIGKKELLSVPILKQLLKQMPFLSVERGEQSKGTKDTEALQALLHQGNSLFIFPEGTFGYAEGLRPFRLGAFKMAVETNTGVCPIALQGTRTILRGDNRLLFPNTVTITISKPIQPEGREWQNVIELRDQVREVIRAHCGEPSLDFIAAQTVAPRASKL